MAEKKEEPKEPKGEALKESREAASKRQTQVLASPLSVVKMDLSELKSFTARLNDFLREPGVAAIRICECCINVD